MSIAALLLRSAAAVGLAYALFLLWMAAGLGLVVLFALLIHGGLRLAQTGDRPLEEWPILRRLLR